jgi:hypothetical protein
VVKEMHKQVKIFVGVAKFALEGTLQDFILGCCVLLDDAQIVLNSIATGMCSALQQSPTLPKCVGHSWRK